MNFQKEYLAIAHGAPEEKTAVLEDLLFRDTRKNKSYVVKRERKGVKKASLTYTLLKTYTDSKDTYSLLKIRLHTGRSHQIRVQMNAIGTPIYGDMRYGGEKAKKGNLALWAYYLSFTHPVSKEKMDNQHIQGALNQSALLPLSSTICNEAKNTVNKKKPIKSVLTPSCF